MVLLGFWQLRRLDEKRDLKALVEARQERAGRRRAGRWCPADAAVGRRRRRGGAATARVTATGTYADDDTVVVENRTFNGASGGWVLTPLRPRRRVGRRREPGLPRVRP